MLWFFFFSPCWRYLLLPVHLWHCYISFLQPMAYESFSLSLFFFTTSVKVIPSFQHSIYDISWPLSSYLLCQCIKTGSKKNNIVCIIQVELSLLFSHWWVTCLWLHVLLCFGSFLPCPSTVLFPMGVLYPVWPT